MVSFEFKQQIKDAYDSRNILYALVYKNLFGRYKNSFFGFFWHFISPLLLLFVYYIVFTQIRSSEIPEFWIYISSALFPFNFMISNIVGGSGCFVDNSSMIKKMYFPREIIVLAQIISSFIVMIIGYIVVLIVIILSGHSIGFSLLIIPLFLILIAFFTTGLLLILSSIVVYSRDLRHLLSTISIIFFFMTPMYFLVDKITGIFSFIIWANPFTYFVESLHYIVYYSSVPPFRYFIICSILSLVSLLLGVYVFHNLKKGFVERL